MSQSKIIAEGLKVSGRFAIQLQTAQGVLDNQFAGVIQQLFGAISDKL